MHNSPSIKGNIALDFNEANRLLFVMRKAGLENTASFRRVHTRVREIVDFHLHNTKVKVEDASHYWCNKRLPQGVSRSSMGPFFPLPPALVFDLKKFLVDGDLVTIANANNWNYDSVKKCLELPRIYRNKFGVTKVSSPPSRYPLAIINELMKTAENNRRNKPDLRKKRLRLRVYIEKNLKPFYHEFQIIQPYIPGTARQLAKAHKESVRAKFKAGLVGSDPTVQSELDTLRPILGGESSFNGIEE
jgi:hypothetical protein